MPQMHKAGISLILLSTLLLIFTNYTPASAAPALLTPTAGSTLSGSTVTFTWTANGATVTTWVLKVGTSVGDASFYNSGNQSSGTLARTASGLPTNGTKVWVRLQWRNSNGTWASTNAQYTTGTGSSSTSTSTSGGSSTSTSSGVAAFYVSTSGNDSKRRSRPPKRVSVRSSACSRDVESRRASDCGQSVS